MTKLKFNHVLLIETVSKLWLVIMNEAEEYDMRSQLQKVIARVAENTKTTQWK